MKYFLSMSSNVNFPWQCPEPMKWNWEVISEFEFRDPTVSSRDRCPVCDALEVNETPAEYSSAYSLCCFAWLGFFCKSTGSSLRFDFPTRSWHQPLVGSCLMLCRRRASTMMCCSEGFFAKTCQDRVSNGGPCCAGAGFCTVETWLSSRGDLSVFGSIFSTAGQITAECVGTVFTSGTSASDTTQQPRLRRSHDSQLCSHARSQISQQGGALFFF